MQFIKHQMPFILFGCAMILMFAYCMKVCASWLLKRRWMQQHGFERYVMGVSRFGDLTYYGWTNPHTKERISEPDLYDLNLRELPKRFPKSAGKI